MDVIVGGLVLAVLGWRAIDAWSADRDKARAVTERLHDRKWAAKERIGAKPVVPPSDAMPEDLVQRIQSWEDEFAKADEERGIKALYAELGDWEKVRRALPALRIQ